MPVTVMSATLTAVASCFRTFASALPHTSVSGRRTPGVAAGMIVTALPPLATSCMANPLYSRSARTTWRKLPARAAARLWFDRIGDLIIACSKACSMLPPGTSLMISLTAPFLFFSKNSRDVCSDVRMCFLSSSCFCWSGSSVV